jgi:hypothetical protein
MYLQAGSTNNAIDVFNAAGTTQLFKLTGTGAATFSSSVTATNGLFNGASTISLKLQNGANANTLALIQSFGTEAAGENASILFKSAANATDSTYAKGLISFRNNGTGYGRGDIYFSINNGTDSANASLSDAKMVILASGNVGIGTTSPNSTLQVRGDNGSSASAVLRIRDTNSTARTTRLQFEDYAGAYADGLIDFKIPTAGSAVGARLDIGVDGAIMSLVRGGNVGIGTTSPTATLHVNGTIQTSSPSSGSAQPWKLGSYAAGGTGTATGVIYIEVNGQIYSIPALLGTP